MLGTSALVVLLAAIVVVTALRRGDNGAATEVGVAHVHGLGVDPADRSLFVATHYGLFRLPEGEGDAERVGDSYQDTMGFTVAGPRRFLGSGHPDLAGLQAGLPGLLGLIESDDAGASWHSLSLQGEVDFHALAAAHGRVYGWDSTSGRFMVSADERTWESRSTLTMSGFAVDPEDADHVIAIAEQGAVESRDGGRTWQPTESPALVVLGWRGDGALYGADAAGTVHVRSTRGAWTELGRIPGSPHAFLATDGVLYVASQDAEDRVGVYESVDEGRTWRLRYRE